VLMGWIVSRSGEWNSALAFAVAANVVAAILWAKLHSPGE